MIAIICAMLGGVTIVISRSINGYLSKRVGPYQSTFFNYLTGLLTSILFMFIMHETYFQETSITTILENPTMFLGGIIGVFNILILNIVVVKVSPVTLTLLTFIAQLASGMLLDYCIYGIFSFHKVIGCFLVVIGLIAYQFADQKETKEASNAILKEYEI